MNNPEISVIIPAYNIREYIGKCLDSVLAQDLTDKNMMEIIAVDDGSTDGTAEVLDGYAAKDGRIHVIHKENGGVSAARNDGIAAARGKYIFFFDGDDFEEPYTCREIYELAEKNQADTVIYGYYRYEDDAVKETCLPRFDATIYEEKDILKSVMPAFVGLSYQNINDWVAGKPDALYVENPALWRTMVKKSVILENHLQFDTTLRVGEDTVFISDYLSCARKCLIQQKCYYYLVTRESSAIFQYEKKPFDKLRGKVALLDGRMNLTNRIKERCGTDITETWAGTVVMSAVEMAFQLSGKNANASRKERYTAYRSYVDDARVQPLIAGFVPDKGSFVKRVPFMLMKKGRFGLLFFATGLMHLIHYEFKR
jgi:glycosyltransferase involved in cell wall biosynthesis